MPQTKHVILGVVLASAVTASIGTFLYVRKVAAAYSLEDIVVEAAPPHPPQPEPPLEPVDPRLAPLEERGDGARLFLSPAPGETILRAGFSSNGTIVVSATSTRDGKEVHRVYSMALDDRRLVAHAESERPMSASSHRPAHLNADLLCFSLLDDVSRDVHCADYLGKDARPLTEHDGAEHLIDPSISPGGDWVAFQVDSTHLKDPVGGTIWKIGANRSGIRQLTRGADDRNPAWSPDGRELYFQRLLDGNWDVYVMDSDGKNPRPILRTHDEDERWPVPAGEKVIVMTAALRDEFPRLRRLDVVTKKGEWLTDGAYGPETYPSVSPDNKLVSFLGPVGPDEIDRLGVWIVPLE